MFKKKGVINVAYRQGFLLQRFKKSNKLVKVLQAFKVSKSMVYFKMKLVKILEKYPKMKKSLTFQKLFENE